MNIIIIYLVLNHTITKMEIIVLTVVRTDSSLDFGWFSIPIVAVRIGSFKESSNQNPEIIKDKSTEC